MKNRCSLKGEDQHVITVTVSPKKETVIASTVSSHLQPISTICGEKKFIKTNENIWQFLSQHSVTKGAKNNYASIGNPKGSYMIPTEEKSHLHDLIYKSVFVEKQPCHLTERPPEDGNTNIKIDLDFKFIETVTERRYTEQQIKQIVSLYHQAIINYLDINPEKLKAFIFERDSSYKSVRGGYKDGIHIIYPDIICHTDIQHLIREYVLLHIEPIIDPLQCENKVNDIVDKSVISTNGWLLYGCSKPDIRPYHLSRIFDSDLNDVDDLDLDERQLMDLLSIRDKPVTHTIRPEHSNLLQPKQTLKQQIVKQKTTSQHSSNLEPIIKLVKLLSIERANEYKKWLDVGLLLHNIDDSLLETWIRFSKLSSHFEEGVCEEKWSTMSTREDGLNLGSLHRWAKMDNPEEYKKLVNGELSHLILNSQSQTTQDVAMVVYYMYKDQYVCVSAKNNTWYEFKNHRWISVESGVTLTKRFGSDVLNEYVKLITYYNQKANELGKTDEHYDEYLQIAKNLTDITYKLRDYTFKQKILKECIVLMIDPTFEAKLDCNPYLFGFENGVYDLKNCIFADGKPDEFLTKSVGYDYTEYEENDPIIVEIFSVLTKSHPQEKIEGDEGTQLDSVLTILASTLLGINKEQSMYFNWGIGANGKTLIMSLLALTLGQYAHTIPSSYFTDRRPVSSSAPTPEIACLNGVRFVYTEEPIDNGSLNISRIKDITGSSKIATRGLYGTTFEFIPQFKPFMSLNDLLDIPSFKKSDHSLPRRLKTIGWESCFIKKGNNIPNNAKYVFDSDDDLPEKIKGWTSQFMFILINYIKYGIPKIKAFDTLLEMYLSSCEPFSSWFENEIEITNKQEDGVALIDLWNNYKSDSRYFKVKTMKKELKEYLEKKGFRMEENMTIKNRRKRNVFVGLVFAESDGSGCQC
jgi:phage/plasmid-associated DNA primase